MTQKRSRTLRDKLTEGAPLAVLLVLSFLILYQLRPVLELIAIAILLSLILQTLLHRLERLVKYRWLAMVMGELLGLIGVVFALPAAVVIMTFFDEFTAKPSSSESVSTHHHTLS
jgi:predicted PurR-regulated permease PerM